MTLFLFALDRLFHLDFNGLGFIVRELGAVFDEPGDAPGRYFRFKEEWGVFMRELPKTDLRNSAGEWGYNWDEP